MCSLGAASRSASLRQDFSPTLGFQFGTLCRFARFLPSHLKRKGTGHGSLHSTLAAGGSDPHHHSSRSILALGAAMAMTSNREAVRVPEQSVESSASAVEWAAIAGGALAAIGISIIISPLASGAGTAAACPWSFSAPAPTTFGVAAAIGLIVTQWVASALGGYLTGGRREFSGTPLKKQSESQSHS